MDFTRLTSFRDWDEAHSNLTAVLHFTPNDPTQLLRPGSEAILPNGEANTGSVNLNTKRKSSEDDEADMSVDGDEAKRTKVDGTIISAPSLALEKDSVLSHARATAAYIPLLELRKKALVDEYFGDGAT